MAQISGVGEIELLTAPLNLVSDMYQMQIVVHERGFGRVLCAQIGDTFHMRHPVFDANAYGVFHEPGQWRLGASAAGGDDAARGPASVAAAR